MNIIKPGFIVKQSALDDLKEATKEIEEVARTCYKSEDRIEEGSDLRLINMLKKKGHEAMLEFGPSITVKFICDRGVSHEVVRHRMTDLAQESTRYCNYTKDKFGNEITVIDISQIMELETGKTLYHPVTQEPVLITVDIVGQWIDIWHAAMMDAEKHYMALTNLCCPAQLSRSVLPNSLKTEIHVKVNIREWRHIFSQRCSPAAHPQMRELMIPLLELFIGVSPVLFSDINH